MPLYEFKKVTTLTDSTVMQIGVQYITPAQMAMIPGVSAELVKQQAEIVARDLDTAIVAAGIATATHAATSKTTPVDADEIPLNNSAASFSLYKLTWGNLKATLQTYFDTLYTFTLAKLEAVFYAQAVKTSTISNLDEFFFVDSSDGHLKQLSYGTLITNMLTGTNLYNLFVSQSSKTTPVDADEIPLADSGGGLKYLSWGNLKATIKAYTDTIYTAKNSSITGATKTKITYDTKGLVTSGVDATQDDIGDGTTYKQYSATDKTKLAGIATAATANSSDATLLNRANHTGTQLASTISNFNVTAAAAAEADLYNYFVSQANKSTPVSLDEFLLLDSTGGNKWINWSQLTGAMQSYLNAHYPTRLFAQYTNASTTGTTEQTLYTNSIAANTLTANGDSITVEYTGITAANTNDKTLKVTFAGTTLLDTAAVISNIGNNKDWKITVTLIRVSNTVVRSSVTLSTTADNPFTKYTEITSLALSSTAYNAVLLATTPDAIGDVTAKMGFGTYYPA